MDRSPGNKPSANFAWSPCPPHHSTQRMTACAPTGTPTHPLSSHPGRRLLTQCTPLEGCLTLGRETLETHRARSALPFSIPAPGFLSLHLPTTQHLITCSLTAFSTTGWKPPESRDSGSPLYPECPELSLVHSWHSIKPCAEEMDNVLKGPEGWPCRHLLVC